MQHGPGAEQSVREVRRDLDTLEDDAAAAARGHVHREGGFAVGRDRGRRIGAARCDRFQVAAQRAAGVRERDAKYRLAAGERRIGTGGAHDERLEIAVAGMHRDDAERGEQEREAEAEVIAVVKRAEQHREQHQPEGGAESGRQDVDAAAEQRHGAAIRALAPADPATRVVSGSREVPWPLRHRGSGDRHRLQEGRRRFGGTASVRAVARAQAMTHDRGQDRLQVFTAARRRARARKAQAWAERKSEMTARGERPAW